MIESAYYRISIHAPTRGATSIGLYSYLVVSRFQSTLPRGERQIYDLLRIRQFRFQSTLPRGERLVALAAVRHFVEISIHAPTRGATETGTGVIVKMTFQSTLPRGERPRRSARSGRTFLFQSTLPRGERHRNFYHISRFVNFNPRSHAGSDIIVSSR